MRIAQLAELFRSSDVVDEIDIPRGKQAQLLARVAGLYERTGLIADGRTPALWKCCPRSEDCWRAALDSRPRDVRGRAGVTLPWIGPEYREGGVAVLLINLRDAGGLFAEYEITCETSGEGSQLNELAAGKRKALGSRAAYGSARSAAAIQDWIAGDEICDREDPRELVPALKSTVRLQAVKCSPQDGRRSSPTPEMAANCPALLLERELAILKPRCVLTLGEAPWLAIKQLPGYTEDDDWTDRFSCGHWHSQACEHIVFSLDHPVSGDHWDRGHQDLLAHLRRAPR